MIKTYFVKAHLMAVGPVKTHKVRKIFSIGRDAAITMTCSDTFEYPVIMGTDADNKTFHLRRRNLNVVVQEEGSQSNRCRRCRWQGDDGVSNIVEVVCIEGSELERFVHLFEYIQAGTTVGTC